MPWARGVGRAVLGVGLCFAAMGTAEPAGAWLLTEHADLTEAAAEALPRRHWKVLDAVWKRARDEPGGGGDAWRRERLCSVFDGEPMTGQTDGCISFALLPALAADHSCSPSDLTRTIAGADWLDELLAEALRVRQALDRARIDPTEVYDVRRLHDVKLQFIDRGYLSRAQISTAHFQPTRRFDELEHHLRDVLALGNAQHALSLYLALHMAALHSAGAAARCAEDALPSGCDAVALAWQAFTEEAFALHFLEDAFSSGHVVGSWGDDAQRKGTHDYYCQRGLDVTTWAGASYVAYGDAYLRDADRRQVSVAASESLRQLAVVLAPLASTETDDRERRVLMAAADRLGLVEEIDVCKAAEVTPGLDTLSGRDFVHAVVASWPRPPRRTPSLPRFDTEYGFYGGGSVAIGLGGIAPLDGSAADVELQAQLGLGVGFSGDGLFQGAAYGRFGVEALLGALHDFRQRDSALGVGAWAHLPFAVFPGDILLLSPFVALGWGWPAEQIAKGGAVPFLRPIPLSDTARFQVVVGHEASVLWFWPRGRDLGRRPSRLQVRVPVMELAFGDRFHGTLGQEWRLSAGFQYDQLGRDQPSAVGGYAALGLRARTFP